MSVRRPHCQSATIPIVFPPSRAWRSVPIRRRRGRSLVVIEEPNLKNCCFRDQPRSLLCKAVERVAFRGNGAIEWSNNAEAVKQCRGIKCSVKNFLEFTTECTSREIKLRLSDTEAHQNEQAEHAKKSSRQIPVTSCRLI